MKAFVKTSVPLVGLCLVGFFYSVTGNVVHTVEAPAQSQALSALDVAIQLRARRDGGADPSRYPGDQLAFDQFLQEVFPDEAAKRMLDVWGTKLVYHRPERGLYVIGSAGPDRRFGTNDDLYLRRSGETREMVHSLREVAGAAETERESPREREGAAWAGKAQDGLATLEDALRRQEADPELKKTVQKIIEGQGATLSEPAAPLPPELLALGPSGNATLATAEGGLERTGEPDPEDGYGEPHAGGARSANGDVDALKDRVSAYVRIQERLEPLLGELEYDAAARAIEALAESPESALLKADLLAMKDDFPAARKLLRSLLREMANSAGSEKAFGTRRGTVTGVRDDSVVLQSQGKEISIGIEEMQPEWIEEMSDLSRMATEGTLYGLGVLYLHRGRAAPAMATFARLGDWHEGVQRQQRWASLAREARAGEALEEIRASYDDKRYPEVKKLIATVRRDYAGSQLVRHARDQLEKWQKESEQATAAMTQSIEDTLSRLDASYEEAQMKVKNWAVRKKDEIANLLEEETQAQLKKWSGEAQKGGKPVRESTRKRVLRSIKQRSKDRMSALQLRVDGFRKAQRSTYLRLQRKARDGEAVSDELASMKLDVFTSGGASEGQLTAEEEARLERRISGSSLLATRRYLIEHNCSKDEAKALGLRLDAFHDSLSEMLCRSEAFREKLEEAEEGRMPVRCLRDRDAFLEYGKEHCPIFDERWGAYYYYIGTSREMALYIGDDYSSAYHEGFHQFMHSAIQCIGQIPQWFNEGLATYYGTGEFKEQRFSLPKEMDRGHLSVARQALGSGAFVPLEEFLQIRTAEWNDAKQAIHYAEGYTLVHFLINYPDKRVAGVFRDFVESLAETGKYDESLNKAFRKVKMSTLEELWRDWIAEAK